jgi:hypothetical protein
MYRELLVRLIILQYLLLASGAAGTKQDITVTATDTFGNKVSGKSITATVFAATATLDTATATTGATLSDFGVATV